MAAGQTVTPRAGVLSAHLAAYRNVATTMAPGKLAQMQKLAHQPPGERPAPIPPPSRDLAQRLALNEQVQRLLVRVSRVGASLQAYDPKAAAGVGEAQQQLKAALVESQQAVWKARTGGGKR